MSVTVAKSAPPAIRILVPGVMVVAGTVTSVTVRISPVVASWASRV